MKIFFILVLFVFLSACKSLDTDNINCNSSESSCPKDMHCNEQTGKCEINLKCSETSPCGDGYYCDNGVCVSYEENGVCKNDSDCVNGMHCINDICQRFSPCSGNINCGYGDCLELQDGMDYFCKCHYGYVHEDQDDFKSACVPPGVRKDCSRDEDCWQDNIPSGICEEGQCNCFIGYHNIDMPNSKCVLDMPDENCGIENLYRSRCNTNGGLEVCLFQEGCTDGECIPYWTVVSSPNDGNSYSCAYNNGVAAYFKSCINDGGCESGDECTSFPYTYYRNAKYCKKANRCNDDGNCNTGRICVLGENGVKYCKNEDYCNEGELRCSPDVVGNIEICRRGVWVPSSFKCQEGEVCLESNFEINYPVCGNNEVCGLHGVKDDSGNCICEYGYHRKDGKCIPDESCDSEGSYRCSLFYDKIEKCDQGNWLLAQGANLCNENQYCMYEKEHGSVTCMDVNTQGSTCGGLGSFLYSATGGRSGFELKPECFCPQHYMNNMDTCVQAKGDCNSDNGENVCGDPLYSVCRDDPNIDEHDGIYMCICAIGYVREIDNDVTSRCVKICNNDGDCDNNEACRGGKCLN